MTTTVKAKDLREGDKIVTPDGTYTVVRNRQVKTKIPARYVKQQKLLLEFSSRKGGVAKKRTDLDTAWDTTEYEIVDRNDLRSKYDRFMRRNQGYVNAFALQCTGTALAFILEASKIIPPPLTVAMIIGTTTASVFLVIREYRK